MRISVDLKTLNFGVIILIEFRSKSGCKRYCVTGVHSVRTGIRLYKHASSIYRRVLAHTLKTNFPLSLSHISFNVFINPVLYENLYFLIHITPWASPPIQSLPSYSLTLVSLFLTLTLLYIS